MPSNFNFAANPAPPVGGLFQNNHKIPTQNNPPIDNFAPRVGFAWQPLASNRLVVRGGFGYFYDRLGRHVTRGRDQGEPYAITVLQSGAANYFSTEAFPYGNPSHSGVDASLDEHQYWRPRPEPARTCPGIGGTELTTPLMDEWNLNTQYEFAPNWVLELGYVGSHGIHQTAAAGRSTRRTGEPEQSHQRHYHQYGCECVSPRTVSRFFASRRLHIETTAET